MKTQLLKKSKILEYPTNSGWWYCVSSYSIHICYVKLERDVYSYIGADMPNQVRKISIQEGLMWLKTTERENEEFTNKFGTLHF